MRVHCTHCGQRIAAEDLNIDAGVAKCRGCNSVFRFLEALDREAAANRTTEDMPAVPRPKDLRVEDWSGNLRIIRRWWSGKFIFLLFFCVAWDSFLVFWYRIATTQEELPSMMAWLMVVFPIGHVAVGVGLTYTVICGMVNRTIVEAGGGLLRVFHTPLPWPGNRRIETADIGQLYCRRRVRTTFNNHHHQHHESYELLALLRDGSRVKLLSSLDDPEIAMYVESEVERYLGIEPRPVRGEYRGD